MVTKCEQLGKLQLSKTSGINKMIQPLYFLPVCACNSYECNCLCFISRFTDELFVSYDLICHLPLNKTRTMKSLSLECANSLPSVLKRKPRKIEKHN